MPREGGGSRPALREIDGILLLDKPQGARFDRFVEFTGEDGKVHVRARTVWALLDKPSGRPLRVTDEIVASFLSSN